MEANTAESENKAKVEYDDCVKNETNVKCEHSVKNEAKLESADVKSEAEEEYDVKNELYDATVINEPIVEYNDSVKYEAEMECDGFSNEARFDYNNMIHEAKEDRDGEAKLHDCDFVMNEAKVKCDDAEVEYNESVKYDAKVECDGFISDGKVQYNDCVLNEAKAECDGGNEVIVEYEDDIVKNEVFIEYKDVKSEDYNEIAKNEPKVEYADVKSEVYNEIAKNEAKVEYEAEIGDCEHRLDYDESVKNHHESCDSIMEKNISDDNGRMELEFEQCLAKMVDIRKKALDNIGIAQQQQKYYYDAKHCKDKEKYEVGTLVLLKNSKKLSRKGSKMEQNWTGPYRIHEVTGKNTFRLSCCRGSEEKILKTLVNITRLKLYHERSTGEVIKKIAIVTVSTLTFCYSGC